MKNFTQIPSIFAAIFISICGMNVANAFYLTTDVNGNPLNPEAKWNLNKKQPAVHFHSVSFPPDWYLVASQAVDQFNSIQGSSLQMTKANQTCEINPGLTDGIICVAAISFSAMGWPPAPAASDIRVSNINGSNEIVDGSVFLNSDLPNWHSATPGKEENKSEGVKLSARPLILHHLAYAIGLDWQHYTPSIQNRDGYKGILDRLLQDEKQAVRYLYPAANIPAHFDLSVSNAKDSTGYFCSTYTGGPQVDCMDYVASPQINGDQISLEYTLQNMGTQSQTGVKVQFSFVDIFDANKVYSIGEVVKDINAGPATPEIGKGNPNGGGSLYPSIQVTYQNTLTIPKSVPAGLYDIYAEVNPGDLIPGDINQANDRKKNPYPSLNYVPPAVCGDFDGNRLVQSADIIKLVNHVFKSGPAPNPSWVGDIDGNGVLQSADIIKLVNYVFKSAAPPTCATN